MQSEIYDIMILGRGPAGLQAAIHAARRKVSLLLVGKMQKSSAYGAHIENYCCLDGLMGEQLLKAGHQKAQEVGARFLDDDVMRLNRRDGLFAAEMESGMTVQCRALIFAMGVSREKLGVKGEKEFQGKGVSYCVDCDAGFYQGEPVAVIGCESAAVTGALTLTFYAKEVHLICEKLEVTNSLAQKIRESAIQIHEGRKVKEIIGEQILKAVILDDGREVHVSGLFIELGARGITQLAGGLGIVLDKETMRYIEANKKQETNVPGVYAAGDICGPPWQVAKAVGEGCVAGLEAAAYVKKMKLTPQPTI
jgi:thioredoxin reductase (NADPH)